jgi:hypothetical protein
VFEKKKEKDKKKKLGQVEIRRGLDQFGPPTGLRAGTASLRPIIPAANADTVSTIAIPRTIWHLLFPQEVRKFSEYCYS